MTSFICGYTWTSWWSEVSTNFAAAVHTVSKGSPSVASLCLVYWTKWIAEFKTSKAAQFPSQRKVEVETWYLVGWQGHHWTIRGQVRWFVQWGSPMWQPNCKVTHWVSMSCLCFVTMSWMGPWMWRLLPVSFYSKAVSCRVGFIGWSFRKRIWWSLSFWQGPSLSWEAVLFHPMKYLPFQNVILTLIYHKCF
jgi:hypothetical protein